ncbi:autotransporter assembly complex protein TamA [Marinobacter oulmenensis]|uniref:Translocation and assembly module subunit TamA n=1 Tax=Marinobacter oulmenensis TaxID=643747 RepID=A0A840U8J9_9GAMM|nr:autotransporter assembly complex family protein [Marinobacter oulmenensis]MBB5321292.1 translocation and assembly module TamA [Marinobacter oulmenensis]
MLQSRFPRYIAAVLLPASLWVCRSALANQVEVEVPGDYGRLQENARVFLGEVEGRTADGLRRYAPTAVEQVREAVRALGYYDPDIRWQVEPAGGDPARLRLTVNPGEPVRIRSRSVHIVEAEPSVQDAFLAALPEHPAEGDTLNHGQYNVLRDTLSNRASRLGYFDGDFLTRRLEVNPDEKVADILLDYRPGERYRLGDVTFTGDHGFDDELLQQFVRFEPGTPYNADDVATLSQDLSNSGYFSGVDVDASPSEASDGVIPVDVGLTPRPPRSVAAGVGFSTDVGPRFRGTWREHYINDQGHRRGAETELAKPRQNVTGWYEIPLDPPMSDSLRFSTGYQREHVEDVQSQRLTLGQHWSHKLDSGWMQVASLRWEGEKYRIGDEPSNTSTLLLPGLSYSKLSADSPLDPSQGYRLQLDVSGSHRALLSDVDILHVNLLAKGLYTLADRHRFLTRFNLGGVATNRFSDVPPSLRFFAGGDQSVRGYGYETLSPEDEDDVAIGGRYLVVGSMEYQYEFIQDWRLAAFYDRGNAVEDLFDPLATGVGMGLRWVSPVGPLRLDIAKGLDEQFGGGWRVHFSMGPEL